MKLVEDRTAILYRGNDKEKEIDRIPYEYILEMAVASKSSKFIIQTDEWEFFEYFKSIFPDTIRFEDQEMINYNPEKVIAPRSTSFVVKFIAALRAISTAKKLIIPTGNTAIWTLFFREHKQNVWQYNNKEHLWERL